MGHAPVDDIVGLADILDERPYALTAALATRAALRSLPLASLWMEWDEEEALPMMLPAFRVLAAAWLAAVERGRTGEVEEPSAAPLAREVDEAIAHATGAVSKATSVVANTPSKEAFDHARNALAAAVRAAYALGSSTPGPHTAYRAIAHATDTADAWNSLNADIEAGLAAFSGGFASQWLTAAPLWPEGMPPWAEEGWKSLRDRLEARQGEHWNVWTDWYAARLDPGAHPDPDPARERARLNIPEALWRLGPKQANPEILSRMK